MMKDFRAMAKQISLFGRKRTSELDGSHHDTMTEMKKDELLAMKLAEINEDAKSSGTLQSLPLDKIKPDPNQPRKTFRNIDALAASIREQGIIQPIIVTPRQPDGCYRIIAGERRYLAAKQAEMNTIPCIIRDADDANIVILQLLENDQRESVSPMEEAEALLKLIETMGVNKNDVARELGRDAAWVSIRLGLKQCSDDIRQMVQDGLIEDVRTLHELRMFESEQPKKAKELMQRIRNNQVSGSYRQVISTLRQGVKAKKNVPAAVRKVEKIEKVGKHLLVHVAGGKHPLQFEITPETLVRFLASVTYD